MSKTMLTKLYKEQDELYSEKLTMKQLRYKFWDLCRRLINHIKRQDKRIAFLEKQLADLIDFYEKEQKNDRHNT